jgi:hypothetical protein
MVFSREVRLPELVPPELLFENYLQDDEFRALNKAKRTSQPKPVNAIKKYSGRELTARMLHAVGERRLTAGDSAALSA